MEDERRELGGGYSMCKGLEVENSLAGLRGRQESGESSEGCGLSQSPGTGMVCSLGDGPSPCPLLCTHMLSISCSTSWTLLLSSLACGKLCPHLQRKPGSWCCTRS